MRRVRPEITSNPAAVTAQRVDTSSLGIRDDCHDHRQRRSNRRDHIADPVHEIENCSFRLGRGLTLDGLARLWRLPKVLGVGHQGRKLERTNHQQIDKNKTAAGVSPIRQSHMLLFRDRA